MKVDAEKCSSAIVWGDEGARRDPSGQQPLLADCTEAERSHLITSDTRELYWEAKKSQKGTQD
ncbi:hypothetical protein RRF57_001890 [Xylaria bambusicola]|uniref:Uncharacterized protein n=1 Tax=Xylaria bambusicola TaxID=326684 RepID=A0AAN7U5K0_9PEZI